MSRVKIIDNDSLLSSPVVANCTMNRERPLVGNDSYTSELRFDFQDWLQSLGEAAPAKWLDVCCGSGSALVEAAELVNLKSVDRQLSIEGIDLAGHFVRHSFSPGLVLKKTSLEAWESTGEYDLVTCVHGLHYFGDKLAAISKMVNCLSPRGLFLANVDLANFKREDGRSAGRTIAKRLREQGIEYDSRSRLLTCHGRQRISDFGFKYLGADDQAGPNYTGQPAVDSYYKSQNACP